MDLSRKYAEIHSSSADAVRRGEYSPDHVPEPGDSRWGLSLVALPSGETAGTLAALAAELNDAAANPHVAYQPEDLHFTVRSLEGHEHHVSDQTVAKYRDRIGRLVHGLGEIQIEIDGLAVTRGGVIACGYPNQALQTLRSRLLEDWQTHGFETTPGGDDAGSRDTAHTSLMVFRAGGHPEPALVDLVEAGAGRGCGVVTTHSLDLVSYQVNEHSVHLQRRAEISW